jgi:geranylgeranyl diphosphate synthase type I
MTGKPQKRTRLEDAVSAFAARTDAVLKAFIDNHRAAPVHLHDAACAYLERPAKRLRPALLLMSCGAAGGDVNQALPAAAAVELFHTWTLVHDDVIDNDRVRRGSPTVHVLGAAMAHDEFSQPPPKAEEYGRDLAILAGDVVQGWCQLLMLDCRARGVPDRVVLDLLTALTGWLYPALLEGETLDVQFSVKPVDAIERNDILRMMTLKTGALLEYAARAGAAVARQAPVHGTPLGDALGTFAQCCGIAFQLQDDILGIVGNEKKLGKPVGSDLREGKRTLIVYHAMQRGIHKDRQLLTQILGNPDATDHQIHLATDCLVRLGAVDETRRTAVRYIERAVAILTEAVPPSKYRDLLLDWAATMVAREF